jgi:hypothetical protein
MIKKFHTKTIFSMLILISLVFVAFLVAPTATAMATTTIYVEPQSIIMRMEENFSVNIIIANVVDLCGWDFKLYYSNSVLNGTSITEGSFLETGGNTYFYVSNFTDAYNATHGLIRAVCTLFALTGVNGGGDLAKIAFKAKGTGETSLKLADTVIVDSAFPPNEIPHITDDGWVTVTWLGDLDIDFDVDYLDDRILGRAYIAYGQTGEYDPRCDFNDDGKIDYLDDRIFGKAYVEYGQTH